MLPGTGKAGLAGEGLVPAENGNANRIMTVRKEREIRCFMAGSCGENIGLNHSSTSTPTDKQISDILHTTEEEVHTRPRLFCQDWGLKYFLNPN